jgi:hypothetical protein
MRDSTAGGSINEDGCASREENKNALSGSEGERARESEMQMEGGQQVDRGDFSQNCRLRNGQALHVANDEDIRARARAAMHGGGRDRLWMRVEVP